MGRTRERLWNELARQLTRVREAHHVLHSDGTARDLALDLEDFLLLALELDER